MTTAFGSPVPANAVIAAAGISGKGLEKLHEIVLPMPVTWMPRTAGWYVILGLVLVAAAWWCSIRVRRYMGNRYRRLALEGLSAIERDLARPGKRARALAEIPALLKRTALSAFPRAEVAELSGEGWLVFLDRTMGAKGFTEGEGRVLSELAYAPSSRLERLPDQTIAGLLHLARRWIENHASV